jgi:hypothetical protein
MAEQQAADPKPRKWSRLVPLSVVVPVALAGLVIIAMAAGLALQTTDKWLDDLWKEIANAGVQVVAVGVLGGLVAAAWKDRELDRASHERGVEAGRATREKELEADRAAREKIRGELMVIVDLYNRVKRVRRTLRSQGLDLVVRRRDHPLDADFALTESQVRAFRRQMRRLTIVQLEFESKVRQFGQTNLLGEDTELVVKRLDGIESFLNNILKAAWEQQGWSIQVGSDASAISEPLQPLFRKDQFRPRLSEPLREITRFMNKYAFGGATAGTNAALDAIVQRHDAEEDLPGR